MLVTHRRGWIPREIPCGRSLAFIGLLAFLLPGIPAGPGLLAPGSSPNSCSPGQPVAEPASILSEEATPDCEPVTIDPFPLRQRQRHLARLGIDRWHAAGHRGQGVKVAVLDSGFKGYKNYLGSVLPARVTVKSFRADGNLEAKNSQHGILCSEVVHALAPDAQLYLANWDPDAPDGFLRAARWAQAQGARVISCSVIMPSWSDGEGGGSVNEALARMTGPGTGRRDMLFFASAGNTAQRHWTGAFQGNDAGFHEWRPGQVNNSLTPWLTGEVSVELYWHAPEATYELLVENVTTGAQVGRSMGRHDQERCCAVVHFLPEPCCTYQVRVRLAEGTQGEFHLVALGGGLRYTTARGSIACPADGAGVLAVAAVNGEGRRPDYSSCGPNSRQPKPDFAAPVPFPSLFRARPFTGTSAAAPQAAAVAALCWSLHPDWTAGQVRLAMRRAARDLGPPGHDYETGYGMIGLPETDAQVARP